MCVAVNEKRILAFFSCGCKHTNLSTIKLCAKVRYSFQKKKRLMYKLHQSLLYDICIPPPYCGFIASSN